MLLSKRMNYTPRNHLANKQNKSNRVILFTNVRDEKNMKEWVTHHLLLNFDMIYIFDHKSIIPLKNEFHNFSKRVVIERGGWNNPVKMPLMKRAVSIAKQHEYDWMLYLDADEFLVLNKFMGVKHLLQTYNFAHSLSINWLMFGTNFHKKDPNGLILENYTKSELYLDKHVKTFVRPEYVVNVTNPHFFIVAFPRRMLSLNLKNNINQPAFNEWRTEYYKVGAYIAHHIYQSEETYMNRKIKLPTDDSGGRRKYDSGIHKRYNSVDNVDVKNKYVPRIKKMLGFYYHKNNMASNKNTDINSTTSTNAT
jgi:hypothetical protein